ncbi:hypothetical protein ACFWP7_22135 [Streptomyces sp. NPDC058470]
MSANPFAAHQSVHAVALIAPSLASADGTWGVGKLRARLPFVRINGCLR